MIFIQTKILRGKLQNAEKEVNRYRQDRQKELDSVREKMESKIKELERQLERTQVQMLFKVSTPFLTHTE